MKSILNFKSGLWLAVFSFAAVVIPGVLAAQETKTEGDALKPVRLEIVDGSAMAKLAPENTSVEFTGVHAEGEPRPRIGGFKKFKGAIGVENDKLTVIEVEFEIASIWTEFDKLTSHLMNADFFEADKFPKASFKSTKLDHLGDGKYNITGELTLHGETSEIEFSGQFNRTEEGVTLTSEFVLDRTQFGMDQMTGGVKKEVDIRVFVGKATPDMESSDGNGGGSGKKKAGGNEETVGTTVTIELPHMT